MKKNSFPLLYHNQQIGIDEMNICEFPITALTAKKNLKPLICENEIVVGGKKIKRQWILDGSLTEGTPVASDEEILMAWLYIAHKEGYKKLNKRTIDYTTYHLCKVSHWDIKGDSYRRHDMSLLRWFAANIKCRHAFYDYNRQIIVPLLEGFHIIEDFKIYGKPRGIEFLDNHLWANPYNSVTFSEKFWQSIISGFVTEIDLDYYFSLRYPISKRIFRYLNKRFKVINPLPQNVQDLCYSHLGLTGNYNLCQLKRELDKAHKELTSKPYKNDKPFLKKYDYPIHSKGRIVIYTGTPAIEFISLSEETKDFDSIIQNSTDIITYFHECLGHKMVMKTNTEKIQADYLFRKYGPTIVKNFIDFALKQKTTDKPRVLGYVLTYEQQFQGELNKIQKIKEIQLQQQVERDHETALLENEQIERSAIKKYALSLPQSDYKKVEQITEQEIEKEEKKLGIKLPGPYKEDKLLENFKKFQTRDIL